MTETQFLELFRLGVVQAVRVVGLPGMTTRFTVLVQLTNGEQKQIHTAKNAVKGYRLDTAASFLASCGLQTVVLDLSTVLTPSPV